MAEGQKEVTEVTVLKPEACSGVLWNLAVVRKNMLATSALKEPRAPLYKERLGL